MPSMERSVSCAERGSAYGGGVAANNLRSYSASYGPRGAPPNKQVSRTRSTTTGAAWSAQPAVQRSGSVVRKPVAGGLNLRSYSASYAASYGPTLDGAGGGGGGQMMKRSGSVTNWSASGRRSVNLRGYTPTFAVLEDNAAPPAVPAAKKAAAAGVVGDAELQRKKRLVVYKVYDVEGKLRSSVRRGVGWIKSRCSRVVYGWW